MTLKPTLIALATLLSSCALQGPDHGAMPASSLRFAYTAEGGKPLGLIRAFDDGQNTTLQFVTDPPASIAVTDDEGRHLVHRRLGQHLVLQGLHDRIRVSRGAVTALVVSTSAQKTELIQQAEPMAGSSTAELELRAARAALQLAQAELAKLKAEKPAPAKVERVESLESTIAMAQQTLQRVTFPFGSSEFRVSKEQEQAILAMAMNANSLIVRGHTDSAVIDEPNQAIALNRALAARNWLIAAGVEPGRVRAMYRSAGGFVADNNTPEGRALNRRVDIEAKPATERRSARASLRP